MEVPRQCLHGWRIFLKLEHWHCMYTIVGLFMHTERGVLRMNGSTLWQSSYRQVGINAVSIIINELIIGLLCGPRGSGEDLPYRKADISGGTCG